MTSQIIINNNSNSNSNNNNNNDDDTATAVAIDIDQSTMFTWKFVEAKFRPSKANLLSDHVDPAEECHMELKPDDETSKALKQHRRSTSEMTDVTEQITDFSFLNDADWLDDDIADYMQNCEEERSQSVVRMLFEVTMVSSAYLLCGCASGPPYQH